MASDQEFVDFVREQSGLGDRLRARKMFGEYALYLHDKTIGFVCDNQLFLKPTEAGRAVLGQVSDGFPYPGAKPHFLIGAELDDHERLQRAMLATAEALPMPKPKVPRRKRKSATETD